MAEYNSEIPDNKVSSRDSVIDSLLDSLLQLTENESTSIDVQDEQTSAEKLFSEPFETPESMNMTNNTSSIASESASIGDIFDCGTNHSESQGNLICSNEHIDPFSPRFFVNLSCDIRNSLNQVKEYARFSEKNLPGDNAAGYLSQIGSKIEQIQRLVDVYIKFHKINTPIKRANTVHTLIDKALQTHSNKLEQKNILLFRKFDNDLPEARVHNKQLEYILDHLLECILISIPSHSGIGIFTSCRVHNEKEAKQQGLLFEGCKYVYISIVLTGAPKPTEQFAKKPGIQSYQQQEKFFGLTMRLVEETVRKNHGLFKIEMDDKKKKTFLS